ncbi:MAG: hypothetical protein KO206_02180 [Methanomicrobiaceae archaeon]|uniref:Uncharacterized protein n=1 Tax=hydrocarbon metagenome TaxID=938273 RepID=A0A0W8FIG1_9ZZZZ|nr:hypothetical protein [Methanomicrobiaceae archaeon]MDD5420050.1 DUF5804 family protein [Methanomicrobiaceae archaeon]
MNILLVQADGVDLFATLLKSETSRAALAFYRPSRLDYGVLIRVASLGSALSLVSELRWYIRRYVRDVFFEVSDGVYCSRLLAEQIYERDVKLEMPWAHRRLSVMRDGRQVASLWMREGTERENYRGDYDPRDELLEIWCASEEHSDT